MNNNKGVEAAGKTQADFTDRNILEFTVILEYKVGEKGNRKKTGPASSDKNNRIHFERMEEVKAQ